MGEGTNAAVAAAVAASLSRSELLTSRRGCRLATGGGRADSVVGVGALGGVADLKWIFEGEPLGGLLVGEGCRF